MDEEFKLFTILSSYPLRRGYEEGAPEETCSGCIVEFRGHRIVLTVSHAVRPDEKWAIELYYEDPKGTKLWEIGTMDFLTEVKSSGVTDVDVAFAKVPDDIESRFQQFDENGKVAHSQRRVVLDCGLDVKPDETQTYGFSGLTRFTKEVQPPSLSHEIAGAKLQVECNMEYMGLEEGLDRFKLDHDHPGDAEYKGCSGAPILSCEGELVGLVIGGCKEKNEIYGLPLRNYTDAIKISLES